MTRPWEVVRDALVDTGLPYSIILDDANRVKYPSAIMFSLGREVEILVSGSLDFGPQVFQVEFRDRPGQDRYARLVDKTEEFIYNIANSGRLTGASWEGDNGFEVGVPSNLNEKNELIVVIVTVEIR